MSKLVNKVDCCLSYDSFLVLCSKAIVQAFLATNASQQDLHRTHAIYGICRLSYDSLLALCSKAIVRTFLAMNASQQELQPA
jgi:hypothetical protein